MNCRRWSILLAAGVFLVGCGDSTPSPASNDDPGAVTPTPDEVREVIEPYGLSPLEKPETDPAKVELGHNLFFDPILAGPRDANCAFCHQMDKATADEFSISAGTQSVIDEHGDRRPGPEHRFTPRISADLFNRGHQDFNTMFWDSRVEELHDGTIVFHERSYPEMPGTYYRSMPEEADSLLAAQNMLPVHDRDELRGAQGTVDIDGEYNELGGVPDHHLEGTWRRLMDRILEVPEYRELLEAAYPDEEVDDLHFAHATNGLAAFITDAFTLTNSPWDKFLAGDDEALDDAQLRGAEHFFGKAGCASCHGGTLLTDQRLYNLAIPPKTRGPEPLDNMDLGAAHRSHAGPGAEFFFRTPPLRNVELTGPYMHNGVYDSLEDVIYHKMYPVESLWVYTGDHLGPVFQAQVHHGHAERERVETTLSPEIFVVPELADDEVADLVAFMEALTDPEAGDLTHLELEEVPSGLPVPDPSERPHIDEIDDDVDNTYDEEL